MEFTFATPYGLKVEKFGEISKCPFGDVKKTYMRRKKNTVPETFGSDFENLSYGIRDNSGAWAITLYLPQKVSNESGFAKVTT